MKQASSGVIYINFIQFKVMGYLLVGGGGGGVVFHIQLMVTLHDRRSIELGLI